jgi:2-phosphoglycerate kinase
MIYLIGGPPRCGKTTVAMRLAHTLNCSRLPVDYLTTAFMNYVPQADWQRLFPNEGVRGDARFATFPPEQIVANYRTKAEHTWPGMRDIIAYALYDRHTLIVEGYQIEPRFVDEILTTYPQFEIKAVFLYRSDVALLSEDLKKGAHPEDWVVRETKEAITFIRIAEMIQQYSTYFCDEAAKYHLSAFNMDDQFFKRIDEVMTYLQSP